MPKRKANNPVERQLRMLREVSKDRGLTPAIRNLVREGAEEYGHNQVIICDDRYRTKGGKVVSHSSDRCQVYTCDRVGKGKGKIRCRTER